LPDDTLFAALDRQGVSHVVMRSDRTHYIVLPSETIKVRKPQRQENVQLQSN